MTDSAAESVANQLSKINVEDTGVSFQGSSLKLNTEHDCKEIICAINNCQKLNFLNLEGNTIGVDAARVIAKALETKGELKRALWKDMFTGRKKEEIPKALEYLGNGLTTAKAQLTELDLSDNAFGPIGVSGLACLLSSSPCYQLQVLKLNNNGLGISGSKMLAKALLNCYKNSFKEGKVFALKILVIGRNRLENDGAIALAKVFETLGSLEEISMPQNGIYHPGIKALSMAFMKNQSLQLLNLNDNTLTKKGAQHIANALPCLQNLKVLNLGDCLLKTEGAKILANALSAKHIKLEELNLGFNEIKVEGGLAIAKAMANKVQLKKLMLNGNEFGLNGVTLLKEALVMNQKISALETLTNDEGNSDDNEDNENSDQKSGSEEEEEEAEEENESKQSFQSFKENESNFAREKQSIVSEHDNLTKFLENISIKPVPQGALKVFLDNPTIDHLLEVKENQITEFINANQDHSVDFYTETYIPLLVKLSSFSSCYSQEIKCLSSKISLALYKDLFKWATDKNQLPIVNNVLFVYFGLIKSEDKNFKINWDVKGSLAALNLAISENFIPQQTQDTLNLLLKMEAEKKNNKSVILVA